MTSSEASSESPRRRGQKESVDLGLFLVGDRVLRKTRSGVGTGSVFVGTKEQADLNGLSYFVKQPDGSQRLYCARPEKRARAQGRK